VSTFLADGNVLVALTVVDHVHHEATLAWFEQDEPDLATYPSREGMLRESRCAKAGVPSMRSRSSTSCAPMRGIGSGRMRS
jgi:hypothetical protein